MNNPLFPLPLLTLTTYKYTDWIISAVVRRRDSLYVMPLYMYRARGMHGRQGVNSI